MRTSNKNEIIEPGLPHNRGPLVGNQLVHGTNESGTDGGMPPRIRSRAFIIAPSIDCIGLEDIRHKGFKGGHIIAKANWCLAILLLSGTGCRRDLKRS